MISLQENKVRKLASKVTILSTRLLCLFVCLYMKMTEEMQKVLGTLKITTSFSVFIVTNTLERC